MISRIAYLLLASMVALVIVNGCDDEETCDCVPPPEARIASIVIGFSSDSDTLYFIPGDPASLMLWALALDGNGEPVAGATLEITISDPLLGVILFQNDSLQNVTNSEGRVEIRYIGQPRVGSQTIYACANDICAHWTFESRPIGSGFSPVTLIVTPQQVEADSNEFVQIHAEATIVDAANRGVPGVTFQISTTGGATTSILPTDSTGRTSFFWNFYNEFGDFTIHLRHESLVDSATVHIEWRDPTPYVDSIAIQFGVPNDTLMFLEDDQVLMNVDFVAFDQYGEPLPGQQVDVSLSNPMLGELEWTNPELRDTTDESGRARALFRTAGLSGLQIFTAYSSEASVQQALILNAVPYRPSQLVASIGNGANDTLYIPEGESDSLQVRAILYDANGNPRFDLEGLLISSEVTGGFLAPLPPLHNGGTRSWWVFHNTYGSFYLRVYNMTGSIPITVLPDTTG